MEKRCWFCEGGENVDIHPACSAEWDRRADNDICVDCGENKIDETYAVKVATCRSCITSGAAPRGSPGT